jgi:hypothetical protein
VSKKDVTLLKEQSDALARTLRVFKGVVART